MISVYDIGNENFEKNGNAILHPQSCKATEDAGGSYEIAMVHPITDSGEWEHLTDGAIIKAPVPVPTIQNAFVGQDVDVYKTTVAADVRSGPSEPVPVTYQTWTAGVVYSVNEKVTNPYDNHNYKCIAFDESSGLINVPPNNNATWWSRIADGTSGAPVLINLPADTEVYLMEDAGGGWYKISTKTSIVGYVKSSQLTFVRHERVEPVPERTVENQLFRIYKVVIQTDQQLVTVNARHVSYDLAGVLLEDCKISQLAPPMAIARIRNAMMIPYRGEIATNMMITDDEIIAEAGRLQEVYFTLGNVDLLDRPQIPAADMIAAGWTEATGTSTVYTCSYKAGSEGLDWRYANIIVHITPIVDRESILSPEQLDEYVEGLLEAISIEGILERDADDLGIVLWVQSLIIDWEEAEARGELYDNLVHQLQAVYYMHDVSEFPTTQELREFDPLIVLQLIGTYTGDISGKNGIYAFLDPDRGIIPYFHGKLIRDNWDIFIMKNDLYDRGVRLTYGANLQGVTWTRNSDNLINRVVPIAKNADGGDLYLPEKWVDSENMALYPVIRMERLKVEGQIGKDDGTETGTNWTEDTLLDQMRTKAAERFSVDHVDAIKVEVQVVFTLLGDTVEYKQYKDLQKLYMYDLVRVIDPRVGLNLQLKVSSITWDCIMNRMENMKVGSVFDYGGRTVFGYSIGEDAIAYEKISLEAIKRIESEVLENVPVP